MAVTIVSKPVDPVTPAATELVKTYAAVADYAHSFSGVSWSYAADPAATDKITVVEDAAGTPVELFRMYVPNKGPGYHPFPTALKSQRGKSLTITLGNANTVNATLNILNYTGAVTA